MLIIKVTFMGLNDHIKILKFTVRYQFVYSQIPWFFFFLYSGQVAHKKHPFTSALAFHHLKPHRNDLILKRFFSDSLWRQHSVPRFMHFQARPLFNPSIAIFSVSRWAVDWRTVDDTVLKETSWVIWDRHIKLALHFECVAIIFSLSKLYLFPFLFFFVFPIFMWFD